MNLFACGAALLLASSMSLAQLSFDNPKNLNLPEDQARWLLRMSCRAVADQLRLRESSVPQFEMRLVLSDEEEHFGYDEHTGVPTLFLHEWNGQKFATAAVRFAVEWSVSLSQQQRIISDVLRRFQETVPVPATHLHNSVTGVTDPPFPQGEDCHLNAGIRDKSCESFPQVQGRTPGLGHLLERR